jgi:glycosyltransferase involved in cell wall biosynthesis
MFNSQFEILNKRIPNDCDVVVVADYFAEDLVGGAELTTEALIKSSPFKIFKLHTKDVTLQNLEEGHSKFWVFGNWAGLNRDLIPTIVANMKYSVLEYDYKYCKYRSPEKHAVAEMKPCDCANDNSGKLASTFYLGAKSLWWMSERQQKRYWKLFPFLESLPQTVLSSVFEEDFWVLLKQLREKNLSVERKGWIVLGSTSWIKGVDDAVEWCKSQGHEYEVVHSLSPGDFLAKLSTAEGLVYLPKGGDTCPRMVIEAKLLGCKLHINENVEHANEEWFTSNDPLETESYLYAARETFWNGIRSAMEWEPKISGYTQTRNCIEQRYPWVESINSLLGFCDEVVVVDGGSTDGTWEKLLELAESEPRLKPLQHVRDWNDKRFALFNGQQKAVAREKCTGDFCWQVDIDEVVHEEDYAKVRNLAKNFPREIDILALPLVEFWGRDGRVRVDVNPWKWRLTRNNPRITHGVPANQRLYDADGTMYSAGSDGDDYIYRDTGENVPFATFMTQEGELSRQHALLGNEEAREYYEAWLNAATEQLPGVYHYSWYDLERKVHTYKNFWSKHWASLYNKTQEDISDNNMFFDKSWAEVTDEEIREIAVKMENEMGGWIFHKRIDFNKPTPHVKIRREQPASMVDWRERSK